MKRTILRCLVIAAALVLSSLCFLYGVLHTVPHAVYTGIRSINASDIHVNMSWIGQCRRGHLLLRNQFTSEPHQGASIRLSYYLLSIPFRFTHISNPLAYHLQRVFCGALLLFALFWVIRNFVDSERQIWIAFLLLAFSSGAGFLLQNWLPESSDRSIPESNLFLSLGDGPHFLLSVLLLWVGIASFYRATRGQRSGLVWCTLCLALLWWDHPFDAVILGAVCAVNVWQIKGYRDRILFFVFAGIVSLPAVLYYRWLEQQAGFAGWAAQNVMLSPSFLSLLSGVLPLLVLGIPGALSLWRQGEKRRLVAFVAAWAAIQFVLAYAPVPYQRRLFAGIQLPIAILAAFALDRLRRNAVVAAVILVCSLGSFVVMRDLIRDISTGGMPFYLPEPYAKAFDWMDAKEENGVIVSGFITGNFIPACTRFTSYIGHSALTAHIIDKRHNVEAFYRKPDSRFLRENGIQYIFWGAEERHMTQMKLETLYPSVYSSGGIWILAAP